MPKNSVAKPRVPLFCYSGRRWGLKMPAFYRSANARSQRRKNVPEAKNVANWQQQITRIWLKRNQMSYEFKWYKPAPCGLCFKSCQKNTFFASVCSSPYSPSVPLFISPKVQGFFIFLPGCLIRIEMLVLGSSLSATRPLEVVPGQAPKRGNGDPRLPVWQTRGWAEKVSRYRGHYITNPNNALSKGNPQNYHTFALFDSPQMGNLMIPEISRYDICVLLEREICCIPKPSLTSKYFSEISSYHRSSLQMYISHLRELQVVQSCTPFRCSPQMSHRSWQWKHGSVFRFPS